MESNLSGLREDEGDLYLRWQMGPPPEGSICRKDVRSGAKGTFERSPWR